MALAGEIALQMKVSGQDIEATAAILLAQYEVAAWTLIAPNPDLDFSDDVDVDVDVDDKEGAEEASFRAELANEFREHCKTLCAESYSILGLMEAGMTLGKDVTLALLASYRYHYPCTP